MIGLARKLIIPLAISSLVFSLSACTKSPSESEDDKDTNLRSGPVKSECGAVVDGSYDSGSVDTSTGINVDVTVVSSELVIVSTEGSEDEEPLEILVKLHGITAEGTNEFQQEGAREEIQKAVGRGAIYIPAGEGCGVSLANGGQGELGQVVTRSGQNINELLIGTGRVFPDPTDACSGDELAACYNSLEVEEEVSSQEITEFLWKPESESNGNLVVLVNASRVIVRVFGSITETLPSNGPSNGFGSTNFGNAPGCAYGQARVEFFDSQGARVLLGNGQESITVNGCQRTELAF